MPYREQIAEALYRAIPVGVGSGGSLKCGLEELDQISDNGMEWAVKSLAVAIFPFPLSLHV